MSLTNSIILKVLLLKKIFNVLLLFNPSLPGHGCPHRPWPESAPVAHWVLPKANRTRCCTTPVNHPLVNIYTSWRSQSTYPRHSFLIIIEKGVPCVFSTPFETPKMTFFVNKWQFFSDSWQFGCAFRNMDHVREKN